MPRFSDEVQDRVNAKHAATAMAFNEAQALMGVPPEARIVMPLHMDTGVFHFSKSKFLNPFQCKILRDSRKMDLPVNPSKLKLGKKFSSVPDMWEDYSLSYFLGCDEELRSFNSTYVGNPQGWQWSKDRHMTVIVWLSDAPEILEFPYIKATPESEPLRIAPKEGTALAIPSHPMYAYKEIPHEGGVPYLIMHGTFKDAVKPPTRH